MRADHPGIAIGINQGSTAVTPEHVQHWAPAVGAEFGRFLDHFVSDILNPASEHISLLEVSRKVPKAVICLVSALSFHEIGTQVPSEVWIAIDVKAWTPRITSPAVRIMRFSGVALHFGVQEKQVTGGKIRVYSPAKTVADCFKFRHKIGLDVTSLCWNGPTRIIPPFLLPVVSGFFWLAGLRRSGVEIARRQSQDVQ